MEEGKKMSTRILVKAKAFSSDPNALQELSDVLHNAYRKSIVTSRPMPSSQQNDYYILITIYGSETQ